MKINNNLLIVNFFGRCVVSPAVMSCSQDGYAPGRAVYTAYKKTVAKIVQGLAAFTLCIYL